MEDTFNILDPYIDPQIDDNAIANNYNMVMYYFQPTEKVAYSYGIKKLYELYHIQSNNNQISSLKLEKEYLTDRILMDKSLRNNKKRFFGNSYEKVLDWYYLLTAYTNDLHNLLIDMKNGKAPANSLKKAINIANEIEDIKQIISDEKQASYDKVKKLTLKKIKSIEDSK